MPDVTAGPNPHLYSLALAASNYAERRSLLDQIGSLPDTSTATLSAVEDWKLQKTARKLSAIQLKLSSGGEHWIATDAPSAGLTNSILEILTKYKIIEQTSAALDPEVHTRIAQLHHSWLNVYSAALDGLPERNYVAHVTAECPSLIDVVCRPFTIWLHNSLNEWIASNQPPARPINIGPAFAIACQNYLVNRVELAVAWAVETDIKVYCARFSTSRRRTDRSAYVEYLAQQFTCRDGYQEFFVRFPVLARWIATLSGTIFDSGCQMLSRLQTDANLIGTEIFHACGPFTLQECHLGQSDPHNGSCAVAILELADADRRWQLVYKPRSVDAEYSLQSLLAAATADGVLAFAEYRILRRADYGWCECLPSDDNVVGDTREVALVYRQLGGYLAFFYALGGCDLHCENILVARGNAFVVDCETMLGVPLFGRRAGAETLADSVYRTGLLERPVAAAARRAGMKISGYGGGESYQAPFTVKRVNAHRHSLALGVEEIDDVIIRATASNRIFLNGALVEPEDYIGDILTGFRVIYDWLAHDRTKTLALIKPLFCHVPVRFINRNTQMYASALTATAHPKCLMDPIEVDLILSVFAEYPRRWDVRGQVSLAEIAALWQRDIPYFVVAAGRTELTQRHASTPLASFEDTPIAAALQRIESLGEDNRDRQIEYIRGSLGPPGDASDRIGRTAIDYACRLGDLICAALERGRAKAPWRTYEFQAHGKELVPVRADLYDGAAGICLFLAYLDAVRPVARYREAAEVALQYVMENLPPYLIGAFQGLAGIIYLLVHLHKLWGRDDLLASAHGLVPRIESEVSNDRYFDILCGAAGAIPVLMALEYYAPGGPLRCASACADHILHHVVERNGSFSWPPRYEEEAVDHLTGFAHGAGGIGWSLIVFGAQTGRSEYVEAGRKAFKYEALHFDRQEGDWYDLRTSRLIANRPRQFANAWCNGSAGIGLSRIDSWSRLGGDDPDLLQDALTATSAVIKNFHRLGNHTLCHGRAGNSELLLRVALKRNDFALRLEANVQAQRIWQELEESQTWSYGVNGTEVSPGLMIGLSGLGLHFLRLADPTSIASPLLLDPPAR